MKVDPAHATSEHVIEIVNTALHETLLVGLIDPIWARPSACAFASLDRRLLEAVLHEALKPAAIVGAA
jgi:hypothetical protein